MSLNLGTTPKGIKKLVYDYVDSVTINDTYYDNYIIAGFSSEQANELLTGREIKMIVSEVMTEQFSALFSDSDTYVYEREDCENDIRNLITEYSGKNDIPLSDAQLSSLTTYTMDISGISGMYSYESPAAYRESIYDKTTVEEYNSVFEVVKTLTSPNFIIITAVLFVVSVVITLFIGTKGESLKKVCDTIIYPSFLIMGVSLGYIFGASNGDVLTEYVFKMVFIGALICFILGLCPLVIITLYHRKKPAYEECGSLENNFEKDSFNRWLSRVKKQYQRKEKKHGEYKSK